MDLYMLESQVGGRYLWERRALLERPSAQRRLRHLRELELERQRGMPHRPAAWRTATHRLGDALVALGERLRAGAAAPAPSG